MDAQTIVLMSVFPDWLKSSLSNYYGGGLTEFSTGAGVMTYDHIVRAAQYGFDSPVAIQELRKQYLEKFINALEN